MKMINYSINRRGRRNMVIRDKRLLHYFCAMCRKSMKVGEKELNICMDCRTELHKLDKQAEKREIKRNHCISWRL
jgi:uncharacterized protein with PIN domain